MTWQAALMSLETRWLNFSGANKVHCPQNNLMKTLCRKTLAPSVGDKTMQVNCGTNQSAVKCTLITGQGNAPSLQNKTISCKVCLTYGTKQCNLITAENDQLYSLADMVEQRDTSSSSPTGPTYHPQISTQDPHTQKIDCSTFTQIAMTFTSSKSCLPQTAWPQISLVL